MDDNWERAKYELKYRIKQESYAFSGNPHPSNLLIFEQKIKKEIELRAYLIYCATKDYTFDNWDNAEKEFNNRNIGSKEEFNKYKNSLIISSGNKLPEYIAHEFAKIEFIRKRAYYLWEDKCREKFDWYQTEANTKIRKKINDKAREVKARDGYLSDEEAWFCARDNAYNDIEKKAQIRREWIARRASVLASENPHRSPEDNWYIAEKEWLTNE